MAGSAAATARSRVTTVGAHGAKTLGLLYRYGGLTLDQLSRLTGLHDRVVARQLGYLERAGRVLRCRDMAVWKTSPRGRPKNVYYLSAPAGARAGARELGIENDRIAVRNYRRVQMPDTAAHRVLANEYLLAVGEAARSSGVECPGEEVYGESCPYFPLFGAGTPKTDRKDAGWKYTRIVPDGALALDAEAASGCQKYFLEVETAVRTSAVSQKVADYAGRWRRLLGPSGDERRFHDPAARIEPLVIVAATDEHAKSLQRSLRERLSGEESWQQTEALLEGKLGAGHFVLLAGFAEASSEPLGRVYRPLREYPGDAGGWFVGLGDAASMAGRATIPGSLKDPED